MHNYYVSMSTLEPVSLLFPPSCFPNKERLGVTQTDALDCFAAFVQAAVNQSTKLDKRKAGKLTKFRVASWSLSQARGKFNVSC